MSKRRSISYQGLIFSPCPTCEGLVFRSATLCFYCGAAIPEEGRFVSSKPTQSERDFFKAVALQHFDVDLTDKNPQEGGQEGDQENLQEDEPKKEGHYQRLANRFSGWFLALSKAKVELSAQEAAVPKEKFYKNQKVQVAFGVVLLIIGGVAFQQMQLPEPCKLTKESKQLQQALKERDVLKIAKLNQENPGITVECIKK